MKKFSGIPGAPPRVNVAAGDSVLPIELPAPPPWWGNGGPGPTQLALALAKGALGDDNEAMAIKVHQRLKWRTVAAWPSSQPWMITEAEIKAHIDEILKWERETAQARKMVELEPPPVVMEGGGGVGGKIEWDSAVDPKPVTKVAEAYADVVQRRAQGTGQFTCSCGRKYHTVGGLQECVATNHGDNS